MNNIKSNRKAGFSLLEILIVLAIAAIIAAISLPGLINPEHKAKMAAREIMSDMQGARMSAISSNQSWSIVFDPSTDSYIVRDGSNTTVKTVDLRVTAGGVSFGGSTGVTEITGVTMGSGVSYTADTLTFGSRGLCNGGTVYVFYNNSNYAIGTLASGLIRIRRWSNGAWE